MKEQLQQKTVSQEEEAGSTRGHMAAVFTVAVWGTTFIATKILLRGMAPAEILFFRFLLAFLVLCAVCPRRMKLKEKKHELLFVGAGLFGITFYYLLENVALTYTLASNAGVIISVTPFFTAILSHIFTKDEKLRSGFFIGFLTAIAGICLISFNGASRFHVNPLGDLLELGAALAWSSYAVFSRKISRYGYNTIQVTRRTFFYGLVFMIPALFLMDFRPDFSVLGNPALLFNFLYLSLGASALCFVTWNTAVKKLGAVKTTIYIYMVPVVTVAASAIILDEKITWMSALGTALTLAGLAISEGRTKSKKEKEAAVDY
ncbi:DMT family transporter [Qiania dongpingensis]|uniref:DMT family transporter n=1 Tax=Qiania dongpingensis TaxID=2763669 RepID=A0A7G9G1N7_9FIRM|nr:DMT family transporter [Qiania dongpingensis]QNM04719.1 DMT family transporter [Qiania dongpingensis]